MKAAIATPNPHFERLRSLPRFDIVANGINDLANHRR